MTREAFPSWTPCNTYVCTIILFRESLWCNVWSGKKLLVASLGSSTATIVKYYITRCFLTWSYMSLFYSEKYHLADSCNIVDTTIGQELCSILRIGNFFPPDQDYRDCWNISSSSVSWDYFFWWWCRQFNTSDIK